VAECGSVCVCLCVSGPGGKEGISS